MSEVSRVGPDVSQRSAGGRQTSLRGSDPCAQTATKQKPLWSSESEEEEEEEGEGGEEMESERGGGGGGGWGRLSFHREVPGGQHGA